MNIQNQTEVMVAQLCERFTLIFEQIKEIKAKRFQLETENANIKKMIDEENLKSISTIQMTNETQISDEEDNSQELIDLQNELSQIQELCQQNADKYQQISQKTEQNKKVIEQLVRQKFQLENEIEYQQKKIQEDQNIQVSIQADLENNLEEINTKNENMTVQLKKIIEQINETEELINNEIQIKYQKENEHKQSLQNYREVLNLNSDLTREIKIIEKQSSKQYEQLKNKQNRLDILQKNKQNMIQKIAQFQKQCGDYEDLVNENQILAGQNEILRLKIQQNIETNELMAQNKQGKKLMSAKKSMTLLSNNSQVSLSGGIQLSRASQSPQGSPVKFNEDLTLSKDDNIYEKKKKIYDLNLQINNIKDQIEQTNFEKDNLKSKYYITKTNTEALQHQYDQMRQEFDIKSQDSPKKNEAQF